MRMTKIEVIATVLIACGIMALTLIGTIGSIAGYFYFKNKKKEKTNRTADYDPDIDYEEEDILDSIPQEEDDGEEGDQE